MPARSGRTSKDDSNDGRMSEFLLLLPATAIKELKMTALSQDVTASSILQAAIATWLGRHGSAKSFSPKAVRASEKRQFLSKMDSELIRRLKVLAIDWRTTASAIAGEAVAEFLSRKGRAGKSK
jgi:hypothetical protein